MLQYLLLEYNYTNQMLLTVLSYLLEAKGISEDFSDLLVAHANLVEHE